MSESIHTLKFMMLGKWVFILWFVSFAVEQSSASECSDDSDDSGGSRDLTRYTCRHCLTTGKIAYL